MKKTISTYLLAASLILSLTASLSAQIDGSYDNTITFLRYELERTDQIIERAKEIVSASNSQEASFILESIIKIQHLAWENFRDGHFLMAANLTKQAREKAKYFIANIPFTEQNEGIVLRRLEKASELLHRIKDEIISYQNHNLSAIFESAEDNLKRAWEFYRDRHFRPALKLSNQVESTLRKILDALNRHEHDLANVERHTENIRELLKNAHHKLADCNSENGLELLEQAENSFRLAKELFAQNKPRAALQALQNCRKLANMALRKCNGFENLLHRYEQIKNDADRISETVPPGNENAHRLLNQVYEQLALAKDFISDEQTKAAAASLKAAQLTLNQVIKLLNNSGF